jgi:hypothetical protein
MELWFLQNDGFLKRLAALSQDQFEFRQGIIDILRKELFKQKAEEIVQNAFLGFLESAIFTDFDPRGDETLVALQQRLAERYIPHNRPDTSDLSPLLEIFKDNAVDESMAANSHLLSEVLSACVFDKFRKTNLNDPDEVKKLGRGVRNLFLKPSGESRNLSIADFESLCGKSISPQELKEIYSL